MGRCGKCPCRIVVAPVPIHRLEGGRGQAICSGAALGSNLKAFGLFLASACRWDKTRGEGGVPQPLGQN